MRYYIVYYQSFLYVDFQIKDTSQGKYRLIKNYDFHLMITEMSQINSNVKDLKLKKKIPFKF